MQLTPLQEIAQSRETVDVFGGLNRNLRIGNNEFSDMNGMCSNDYPALSTRPRHSNSFRPEFFRAAITKYHGSIRSEDFYFFVDGNKLHLNDHIIATVEDSDKQFVKIGNVIVIFPDKLYINLDDPDVVEHMESSLSTTGTVTYTPCDIEGTPFSNITTKKTAPANPTDGMLWLDTSETPNVLKRYSNNESMWLSVNTTYVKIQFSRATMEQLPYGTLQRVFEKNDGVEIKGILASRLKDLNGKTSILIDVGDDWVIITGLISGVLSQTATLTIKRNVPDLDFVTEANNRLWGCKWGSNNDGKRINEIYASQLGNFKNWNCFMGVSTDSYTASVGATGAFTGATKYNGYPIFFKKDRMYKVYGEYPANFQIQEHTVDGVAYNAYKSIATVGNRLFYRSESGVMVYDGSFPTKISSQLGKFGTGGSVGVGYNDKYYLFDGYNYNEVPNTPTGVYVYDSETNLWMREDDNIFVYDFFVADNRLIYVGKELSDSSATIHVKQWETFNDDSIPDNNVKWSITTGKYGDTLPEKKYISRLMVKMSLEYGGKADVYIQYDSEDRWSHVTNIKGTKLKNFSIPIRVRRCDHFRLKIAGEGEAKFYSITKIIEEGSEL